MRRSHRSWIVLSCCLPPLLWAGCKAGPAGKGKPEARPSETTAPRSAQSRPATVPPFDVSPSGDAPAPPDVWRQAVRLADEALGSSRLTSRAGAAAAELAERAAEARKSGDPLSAAALAEAALLLDSARLDTRRFVVRVYGDLATQQLQAVGERTLAQITEGSTFYFRGMAHAEVYLRRATAEDVRRQDGGFGFFSQLVQSAGGFGLSGHPTPAVREAAAACRQREREAILRIVRLRARDRRNDEWDYVSHALWDLPPGPALGLLGDLIEELKDVPDVAHRVRHFTDRGHVAGALLTPEGRAFIDRLAASDSAEVRSAAEEVRRSLPALEERMRQHQALVERMKQGPPPVPPPADAGGEAVAFDLLDLKVRQADGQGKPRPRGVISCLAVGEGLDVFWDRGRLYVMTERGMLVPLYEADRNAMINEPCFDGRYVWAPVVLHEPKEPLFVVADPWSRQVWTVTAADGLLPTSGGIESPTASGHGQAAVAPLSPGRACLAGAGEGRAWLATATFDPATGRAQVRVFHQAAEPPDPDAKDFWRRPGVVFNPLWMRTLAAWRGAEGGAEPGGTGAGGPEAGAAEAGEVRVLVFRNSSDPAIANHLLVADPDTGTVSVLEDETIAWTGEAVAARGAGAYCAWYPAAGDAEAGSGPCLWRVGLPDVRRRCVARGIIPLRPGEQGPQRFSVAFARGRVYLFGDQLWVAPKPEGPFRRVSGTPPEYKLVGEPALRESAHYGLVLTVWNKVYGARFGAAAAR